MESVTDSDPTTTNGDGDGEIINRQIDGPVEPPEDCLGEFVDDRTGDVLDAYRAALDPDVPEQVQ